MFTLDGARWVLEYRDGARYRVIHRQSPESGGVYDEYRDLCLTILNAGHVRIALGDMY